MHPRHTVITKVGLGNLPRVIDADQQVVATLICGRVAGQNKQALRLIVILRIGVKARRTCDLGIGAGILARLDQPGTDPTVTA